MKGLSLLAFLFCIGNIRACGPKPPRPKPSSPSPSPSPVSGGSCGSYDGQCMNFRSCNGIVIGGICPGNSLNKCCAPDGNYGTILKHVNKAEGGLYLKGYIPSSESGVTIASGVDLGQQSEAGLKRKGVTGNPQFWAKLRPYLGLSTRQAVKKAGLNPEDLKLTLQEGLALDNAFNVDNLRRHAQYTRNLSVQGKAVIASLAHWCYAVVRTHSDGKCYNRKCGTNFLRDTLRSGRATDGRLKQALLQQRRCYEQLYPRGSKQRYKVQRLTDEIEFLQ